MSQGARPFRATLTCTIVGIAALVVWLTTFAPHGGLNLHWLFPVNLLLHAMFFAGGPFPVVLWYLSAVGQWIVFGLLIDLIRAAARRRRDGGA